MPLISEVTIHTFKMPVAESATTVSSEPRRNKKPRLQIGYTLFLNSNMVIMVIWNMTYFNKIK